MKLTYSIALLLSVSFIQCITATTHMEKSEVLFVKRRESLPSEYFRPVKRSLVATALRRRNNGNAFYQPTTGNTMRPPVTIDSLLNDISASIKQLLVSDDSSSDGGKEHEHNNEDRDDKRARKEMLKLVKELGKAIDDMLKEAGIKNSLDLDATLKAAEKGELYPSPLDERGLEEDQTKKSAEKIHEKVQAASKKVTQTLDQMVGFAGQMEDDNVPVLRILIAKVNLLVNMILQQNP
ncbi:hypothetical protein BC941DRAFT_466521 [Chlamydoabsidia padenii]|nr:hypothetical protein BC941DRAFT_466521 [Chlamydoabsidia padenii]